MLTHRITVPITIISGVLLAVGIAGAWYVHRLQKRASDTLDFNVTSIRAAEELELHVRETRSRINRFLLSNDATHFEEARGLVRGTQYWLEEASRLAGTAKEQALMRQVRDGMDAFFAAMRDFSDSESEQVPRERLEELSNELLTTKVLRPAREYLDFNEQEVARSSERNKAMARRVALALLLLGTCGSIAGLAAGYGLARAISRSIVQLVVRARDVTDLLDDVTEPLSISLTSDAPIQQLDALLQKMSERVTAVINQLRQSHRETLRAEQLGAVGQLAAGVAHELRNPLMCMKLLVQAASKPDSTGRLEGRDLHVLIEEIGRLESLVQTLLDFARPGQLNIARVDLSTVVEQTVNLLAGRAGRQRVTIRLNRPDRPLYVEADSAQMRQVVLNLVLNALDATPDGGTVNVSLRHEDTADRNGGSGMSGVLLEVLDTGRGLPGTLGDRIFEPFVSTKETGIGLGLVICKRIVESHGGTITAADQNGGGTTFTVRLSYWAAAQPSAENRTSDLETIGCGDC